MTQNQQPSDGWGTLTVVPDSFQTRRLNGVDVRERVLQWRPGSRQREYLPESFTLDLRESEAGGHRQILPHDDFSAFLIQAAQAGLATHRSFGNLSAEQYASEQLRLTLFQLGKHRQERLDRRLKYAKDLKIGPAGAQYLLAFVEPQQSRASCDERIVGQFVGRLRQAGRAAAEQAGADATKVDNQVAYGINHEAGQYARQYAGEQSEGGAHRLRTLVFGVGPADEPVPTDVHKLVLDRFVDLLSLHLDDNTDEFNTWFVRNYSRILRSLAQSSSQNGQISRHVVRDVLLAEIFESWRTVGQSINVMMEIVSRLMDPPLSPESLAVFRALYRRNPLFAEIPLVMLHEHFPLLKPTFEAILESPEKATAWLRLERALQIHAGLQLAVRATDKARKAPNGPQRDVFQPLVANVERAASYIDVEAAITAIMQDQSPCHACNSQMPLVYRDYRPSQSEATLDLVLHCETCDAELIRKVPRSVLRDLVEATGLGEHQLLP